jgi:LytS/YehU family sensor histidine kinase
LNELEKENVLSQLKSLKSQINPHFLFNNFNTLISIIEENPNIAVEYVETLSDYFRSMLQYRDKDLISLTEELEIIKNYVYLIKKRYGDNFSLKYSVDESLSVNYSVIPMTLQLLVENAVKHNIISKDKPLEVEVYLNGENTIIIKNNLQPKMTKSPSTKFGLQSIKKRYDLISNQKIMISEDEHTFSVSIPIIKNLAK